MANNKNIFEEAEKYKETVSAEINTHKGNLDYKKLIAEREQKLLEIEKRTEEAYITGNIILGDELTAEKNNLKDSIETLKKINPEQARKELALKYADTSHEFYRLVVNAFKEEEAKDLEKVKKLLNELAEVTGRASERRDKCLTLINGWNNGVVTFEKGESLIFHTDLSFIDNELKKDFYSRIRNGGGRTIIW